MKLDNRTRAHALLYRGGVDEHRLFGSVFTRVTYDWRGRELSVADEQFWQVSNGPYDCEYGPMDGDEVFYRGGVDLFVFGHARPPRGSAVQWLELGIQVGQSFQHRLWVFGERWWMRQNGGLAMSEPAPFREMPLSLTHAYGGGFEWDGLVVPFPDNPAGKGYYRDEASAEGKPLPNLEHPDRRVASWQDQPEPVGTGATTMQFGPRLRRSVVFDERTHRMKELKPTFFNSAFPEMIVPSVQPGDPIVITGVSEAGVVGFRMPELPFRVQLRFGDELIERTPAVDQIGIEPDRGRVFIAYRYPFRYKLIPMQERECILETSLDTLRS